MDYSLLNENMVNQKESYSKSFPDISPGWVYDEKNGKMVGNVAAPSIFSSLKLDDLVFLNEQSLKNLTEIKDEYIWKGEFESADEMHCFVFSFTGTYSKNLESLEHVTEGTVIEVKYRKCVKMFVCSTEKSSYDECAEYLKKISNGLEAELDTITTESCKKCYIYNSNSEKQSFTSVMRCFKEFTRIFDEIKSYKNFDILSWKFITLSNNSEVCNANISPDSNFIPDININSDETKSVCQNFMGNSDDAIEESEKNFTCNSNEHSEVTVQKSKSFKKKIKMNEENSITKISTVSVSNPPPKSFTQELESTNLSTRNCSGFKELPKAGKFQNIGSQTCEVNKDSMNVSLSRPINNDATSDLMDNLETPLHSMPLKVNGQSQFIVDVHDKILNYSSIKSTKVEESFENTKVEKSNEKSLIENESSQVYCSNLEQKSEIGSTGDQLEPALIDMSMTSVQGTLIPCELSIQTTRMIKSYEERDIKKQSIINCGGREIALTISELSGIRNVEIGNGINKENGKVLILLGATGSGKTSLVNLCANFYFGAVSAEEEKLIIVESKIKTDRVTVYTFYPEVENQIPLTVVDTPGLNDSTGAEIHDHVDALKSFLALACIQGLKINAICFVAQAHLVRLTSSEKFVMDYVKSLFGSEVEKHTMVLVTFSDNQRTPPVIEAMEQYGFKSPFFVKFNNTLLISKTEVVDDLDKIYWRTGLRSWKKCLKHLSSMVSLPNAAVSSVKDEVLLKTVFSNHTTNLHGEIRALIIMCSNIQNCSNFFTDSDLLLLRTKLWMVSNIAYYAFGDQCEDSKEVFLIKEYKQFLTKDMNIPLVDVALFLLLDNESSMRNVLVALVSSFSKIHKMISKFNSITEVESKNVQSAYCSVCRTNCLLEREFNNDHVGCQMGFKCTCSCSDNRHGSSQQEIPALPIQTSLWMNILKVTVQRIIVEMSKYCTDESCQFDIRKILIALGANESENFKRDCYILQFSLECYGLL